MKNQIANLIEIIPVVFIASQTKDTITTKTGKTMLKYYTSESKFEQSSNIENGNHYVSQTDERVVTDMPDYVQRNLNGCDVAVILETTSGVRRVWGDRDNPVQCVIKYDTSGVKLSLTRKSPTPLLF